MEEKYLKVIEYGNKHSKRGEVKPESVEECKDYSDKKTTFLIVMGKQDGLEFMYSYSMPKGLFNFDYGEFKISWDYEETNLQKDTIQCTKIV